jgi:diphosphomevalonate decarboxylase
MGKGAGGLGPFPRCSIVQALRRQYNLADMIACASATATAGANIAIVKHWGVRDERLRLPANTSLSLTLDLLTATTSIAFDSALPADGFVLDGAPANAEQARRVSAHLDALRALACLAARARVTSVNTFPSGAGLAASAAGFAALTVAAAHALRLRLSPTELSALARLGSGSAARSIFGGWVEGRTGATHEAAVAVQIAPPEHWDVRDVIAVIRTEAKEVSSRRGHEAAPSSPFYEARLRAVDESLQAARHAVRNRDFALLGETAEAETLSMHAVMMTGRPALLYWLPDTLELIHAVRRWRSEGLACYFSIDAGPNVHVLTLPGQAPEIARRLATMPFVRRIIECGPGPGARVQ